MHYKRWKKYDDPLMTLRGVKRSPSERFWEKVDQGGGPDACWTWLGAKVRGGYGHFDHGMAHRFAWMESFGPVPDGLELDHVCHVKGECLAGNACPHRACVNPAHLEPVTREENMRRGNPRGSDGAAAYQRGKTHCPQGHPYDEANTYRPPGRPNARKCRTCIDAYNARQKTRVAA